MKHASAAILSIGDELTLGQGLDTNSQWLSQRLIEMGITPVEHSTVPDSAAAPEMP
jgi:nicotinamide-nucleotide amidase